MSISSAQTQFYEKLKFLSSIPSKNPINPSSFIQDDLFQICQYVQPVMITNNKYNKNLVKRVSEYRDQRNGDTCLHIAAKASNSKLVQYILQNNIVNADSLNSIKQTALTSLLSNSTDRKAQKVAYILAKYTDLTLRNKQQKRAYQVYQARMDPMRARLIQFLKNKAAGK